MDGSPGTRAPDREACDGAGQLEKRTSDHVLYMMASNRGRPMATRDQTLAEAYELALHNDMTYYG